MWGTLQRSFDLRQHAGSPPRMWGTLARAIPAARRCRFTPTHVGNTGDHDRRTARLAVHPHACGEHGSSDWCPTNMPVHPHACGEHALLRDIEWDVAGSPPRMWGTRVAAPMCSTNCMVHPHACGEHLLRLDERRVNDGSPPRMWGTRHPACVDENDKRFTPTHVGNTGSPRNRFPPLSVHPHACGEHWSSIAGSLRLIGSPPRMWGTRSLLCNMLPLLRFTPTHVGNTQCKYRASVNNTVHPHACGEHGIQRVSTKTTNGSPPRMWGTPRRPPQQRKPLRFTPTHVGNTVLFRPAPGLPAVHPHACGEHSFPLRSTVRMYGSPPRMWGTLTGCLPLQSVARFTPTHVGNTVAETP